MRLDFQHFTMIILLASVFLNAAPETSKDLRHLGVTLPHGLKRLGENRFQSSRTYEETKKDFAERFVKSATIKRFGDEINLPHVRAIFYRNSDPNAPFFGINIYLNVQTELTEIFFLVNH